MVVNFEEFPEDFYAIATIDKTKTEYRIERDLTGYGHFIFKVNKGSVPKDLSGKYSSILKAYKALEQYSNIVPETNTVRRETFAKAREERKNAAVSNSKAS
jgi:hypothetical protein